MLLRHSVAVLVRMQISSHLSAAARNAYIQYRSNTNQGSCGQACCIFAVLIK